jgi:hypothetical protein
LTDQRARLYQIERERKRWRRLGYRNLEIYERYEKERKKERESE